MSGWKLAGWIGAAGAAAVAAGAAVVWKITVKSQTPMRRPMIGLPPEPYEAVSFPSGGATLKGWFVPPKTGSASGEGARHPLMIVVHGWGSNKSRVLRYTDRLYNEGYALLLFDARSHGDSDEHPTPTGLTFRDDVLAAIAYARSREDVDPERIGLLGHSMGGYGSLLALGKQAPVQAVVTDSMPVQLDTVVRAELKRRRMPAFPLSSVIPRVVYLRSGITRRNLHELDVVAAVRSSRTPVLLVHSTGDMFIPSSELDYLVAGAERPGLAHLFVSSEGHSSSETDSRFWEQVLPFLRQHVLKQQVPAGEGRPAYLSAQRRGPASAPPQTAPAAETAADVPVPAPLIPGESG
ncbi:hypothetical protein J31TS4_13580 [Paenibacillus sp. J31TS4]|uniref:alpha/beta hydrolase n=1 Tax=Paenibacillus sp. J31TS4 TaxID=2807195 RepID=UPI001B16FA03|nr:alpha/beta fold hydrolase [Paenibacillus sp. J31TS4]GIP38078.1 hypothetical protein J31TS4_13580 [Paenibacillus sp. J31TS4]